jgi:hypothetical protein
LLIEKIEYSSPMTLTTWTTDGFLLIAIPGSSFCLVLRGTSTL